MQLMTTKVLHNFITEFATQVEYHLRTQIKRNTDMRIFSMSFIHFVFTSSQVIITMIHMHVSQSIKNVLNFKNNYW